MKKVILVYTQLNEFGGIEYLFVQLAKFLKKILMVNHKLQWKWILFLRKKEVNNMLMYIKELIHMFKLSCVMINIG